MSLIELLVVIAIIAMLIAMLIPSLKRSMRLAAATVCMHNLREVGHGLTMYRFENDGWLPKNPPSDRTVTINSEFENEPDAWFMKLFPAYLPDAAVLTCPEDPYRFRLLSSLDRLNDPQVSEYVSYGLNGFILNAGGGFLSNLDRYRPTRPLDTILAADLGPDDLQGIPGPMRGARSKQGPRRNHARLSWDDGYRPFTPAESTEAPWLTLRHNEGINVLTLDGGVREARTADTVRRLIRPYYQDCGRAGCTLCNLLVLHYSFARDGLYWWTGPVSPE